jgi:hypothetical protein
MEVFGKSQFKVPEVRVKNTTYFTPLRRPTKWSSLILGPSVRVGADTTFYEILNSLNTCISASLFILTRGE